METVVRILEQVLFRLVGVFELLERIVHPFMGFAKLNPEVVIQVDGVRVTFMLGTILIFGLVALL